MHLPLPRQFPTSDVPAVPSGAASGLTFFFPAYNDAGTIGSLVVRAVQTASALTSDFEILVINDGSEDATGTIVEELARTYPQVKVIHHPRNRGYGGALRTGFGAASKALIAYTDGDGQYDAAELGTLWAQLTPEIDIVTGYKISRSDPMHRIVIGRVYHHAVKLLFGLRVRDVDCDFRLIRREVFERVGLEHDSGVICLELMRKVQDAGFRIVEVPVHHYHRTHGRSQFFNVRRVVRTGLDVLRLWVQLVVRRRLPHATPALFPRRTVVSSTEVSE